CTLTVNASTSVGASFAAPPGSGNGGGSSGGSNSGSGGGGGALDLLSVVALASLAASRRASRHHRPGSCYVGSSASSFAELSAKLETTRLCHAASFPHVQ